METARGTTFQGGVNWSRGLLALLCISFALVMIDGYDLFIVSFVAPLIARDLHLNFVNIGTVFAAGLAGSMVGGLLLGHISDRVGRRPILLASLATAGVSTLLCSQAHSLGAFASLRFLTGFALGGLLAAIVPLVAEHFPRQQRSAAVTVMFIGYPLGAVIGGAITALLIDHGWRNLFLGAGVVTLLLVPIGLLLRETLYASDAPNDDPRRQSLERIFHCLVYRRTLLDHGHCLTRDLLPAIGGLSSEQLDSVDSGQIGFQPTDGCLVRGATESGRCNRCAELNLARGEIRSIQSGDFDGRQRLTRRCFAWLPIRFHWSILFRPQCHWPPGDWRATERSGDLCATVSPAHAQCRSGLAVCRGPVRIGIGAHHRRAVIVRKHFRPTVVRADRNPYSSLRRRVHSSRPATTKIEMIHVLIWNQ